ncbi:MAG: LysR substrate-binding domain-containing protein [Paracoccaceae bacterium]
MSTQVTLKHLLYFTTLAETGHYRRAAERIGISQPSLSLQIRNFEDVLNLKLIERGRAGAVLTPEGREVLERARKIVADVTVLQQTSERMKAGLVGTLRLGSSPTLGPYLLPNVIQNLHGAYPDLRLVIRDGAPSDLIDALLQGEHDLILTQLPVQSADARVVRLLREPLYLAVAQDHPLAGKEQATDTDLRGESILVLSNRFTLHAQIAQLSEEIGAHLKREYEGTSLDALRQMTAMNMGVTFLPALYARSEVPHSAGDVVLVPYRAGRLFRSIGLVTRKSSGSQKSFDIIAEMIRSVARKRFKGVVQVES